MSGFLKNIYCLFLYPVVFRKLKTEKWWKGLITLLVMTVVVSGTLFFFQLPSQMKQGNQWANWFAEQVREISPGADGKLNFVTDKKLPFSSSRGSFLLIVEKEAKNFSQKKLDAPSGVWMSPELIVYWQNVGEENVIYEVFNEGVFWDYFAMEQVFPENQPLRSDEYKALAGNTILAFMCFTLIARFVVMILYLVVLVLMHKLIGSPAFAGLSFLDALGVYAFASVPAMTFAVIYSSIGLDFLDFNTAYLFSLLFYIFFVAGRYIIPQELLKPKA